MGRKGRIQDREKPCTQTPDQAAFQFDVAVGSFVEGSAGEDADYFGSLKPLLLKIVAVKALQSGKYRLEAKLTYFYCSELEKYCSRSIETLAIPIEVANK